MATPVDADTHAAAGNNCSLPRRLAAMLYDSVLVFGLLFAALTLLTIPAQLWFGFEVSGASPWTRIYLLAVAALFHLGFWTHGGRTLGMQAWRLRLVSLDGGRVSWRAATIRYLVALVSLAAAGLGFWWSLFDRERRTWHDLASRTRLVVEPR
jgi:uncharacterized RDD family membrane protein YckC